MKRNVGTVDKVVRIGLVVVVAVLFSAHQISGVVAAVLGALAAILVLTSLISFCPLYFPFGISTAKK